MRVVETLRYTRRNLPHWEVKGGRYFVTVRCAGSLPSEIVERLADIRKDILATTANSAQFVGLQRRYFATVERYLDSEAAASLGDVRVAQVVATELEEVRDWQVSVPHYTVLPNHWHALIVSDPAGQHSLAALMKRIKGRSAHRIREAVGGCGPVWQREWFDRWVRDDAEWQRCVDYIRNNPVKAGLVRDWCEHPWTK